MCPPLMEEGQGGVGFYNRRTGIKTFLEGPFRYITGRSEVRSISGGLYGFVV